MEAREMDGNQKLLVLEGGEGAQGRRLGARLDRSKVLNAIAASGARLRHDSGGRLMVVEVPEEAEQALAERLPNVRLLPVDADVKDEIADLDPTESLFLDALKLRTSDSFREAKRQRRFGETPEEQRLFTAPDIREEY
jgi:hypothetical protein